MKLKNLRQAMRTAGLATLAAGAALGEDPAMACSKCTSCQPGCSTCQSCSTGGSTTIGTTNLEAQECQAIS